MTKQQKAMQLALEAFSVIATADNLDWIRHQAEQQATALREALAEQPAQQKPWGFHIQFNNGRDATFRGLDHLAECEVLQEAGETITLLYTKERNT